MYVKRNSFLDVDVEKTPYISYAVVCFKNRFIKQKIPRCNDFKYGKRKSIILFNKTTKRKEKIRYRLVGAVPFSSRDGYHWYWGEVESQDHNASLIFYFKLDGTIKDIKISFCGKSIDSQTFKAMNDKISYAAKITAMGKYGLY